MMSLDDKLLNAAERGNIYEVVDIIYDGGNVNARGHNNSDNVLMIAARNGHIDIVKELIREGAHVNAIRSYDLTALMVAADAGQADVVKILLENGADWSMKSSMGYTALDLAQQRGRKEVVSVIKSYLAKTPARETAVKNAHEQTIRVEADSLQEARAMLKAKIPQGLMLVEEKVVGDGKQSTREGKGKTREDAILEAKAKIPPSAETLAMDIVEASQRMIVVEANEEASAHAFAGDQLAQDETIESIDLRAKGKRGFLGIGKSPNQYNVQVRKNAIARIAYKTRACIIGKIAKPLQEHFIDIFSTTGYNYSIINADTVSRSRMADEILAQIRKRQTVMASNINKYWAGEARSPHHPGGSVSPLKQGTSRCRQCGEMYLFEWYDNTFPSCYYKACQRCKLIYVQVD